MGVYRDVIPKNGEEVESVMNNGIIEWLIGIRACLEFPEFGGCLNQVVFWIGLMGTQDY